MCEGMLVDVMVVIVWWSLLCEGRTVDIMVVIVCWR